jgi:hypothetical protein
MSHRVIGNAATRRRIRHSKIFRYQYHQDFKVRQAQSLTDYNIQSTYYLITFNIKYVIQNSNKVNRYNTNVYKRLIGLQYHAMVNPKTTALPL